VIHAESAADHSRHKVQRLVWVSSSPFLLFSPFLPSLHSSLLLFLSLPLFPPPLWPTDKRSGKCFSCSSGCGQNCCSGCGQIRPPNDMWRVWGFKKCSFRAVHQIIACTHTNQSFRWRKLRNRDRFPRVHCLATT